MQWQGGSKSIWPFRNWPLLNDLSIPAQGFNKEAISEKAPPAPVAKKPAAKSAPAAKTKSMFNVRRKNVLEKGGYRDEKDL